MIQRVLKYNFICPKSSNNKTIASNLPLKHLTTDTLSFKGSGLPLIPSKLLIESLAEQIYDEFEVVLNQAEEHLANYGKIKQPNYSAIKKILAPLDVVTTALVLNHLVRLLEEDNADVIDKINMAKILTSVYNVKKVMHAEKSSISTKGELLKEETILKSALNLCRSAWNELDPKPELNDKIVKLEKTIFSTSNDGFNDNDHTFIIFLNKILRKTIKLYQQEMKKFTEDQ